MVVKEVFNRLLGFHGDSPITPTDLLVSLHLIDANKADLKTVMKATSMCLQEKQVFTQEVLAVVLQQLMDQTPLPTLLMRTVIQALSSYPRLSGFVMNILQRLILKKVRNRDMSFSCNKSLILTLFKVWKQKVVWEGFIKCCQRTKPQSFAVLMQLPAPQLTEALKICPDLRQPLRDHLLTFTEAQRAHIPTATQEIVLGPYTASPPDTVQPAAVPLSQPDVVVCDPLFPSTFIKFHKFFCRFWIQMFLCHHLRRSRYPQEWNKYFKYNIYYYVIKFFIIVLYIFLLIVICKQH